MDVGLTAAGVISLGLAAGHATIGVRRVLPGLATVQSGLDSGTARGSRTMIRITWHIVTIFALASGAVLMTLSLSETADARLIILRGFAAMWATATIMAFWVARPRTVRRMPVPMLWAVLAVLCWQASL